MTHLHGRQVVVQTLGEDQGPLQHLLGRGDLLAHLVEVELERVDLGSQLRARRRLVGLDDLPAHLDDVLDLGLDVGERVVDALGVVQLALHALDVGGGQLGEVDLLADVPELPEIKNRNFSFVTDTIEEYF